ncbi:hypothetical protein BR93DRAFT_310837 [Coniochaeta sp. PMI_546]|nr:hypothetical protein BR93DRAFT_310837 [Coniochaeta sp. PMI_546]
MWRGDCRTTGDAMAVATAWSGIPQHGMNDLHCVTTATGRRVRPFPGSRMHSLSMMRYHTAAWPDTVWKWGIQRPSLRLESQKELYTYRTRKGYPSNHPYSDAVQSRVFSVFGGISFLSSCGTRLTKEKDVQPWSSLVAQKKKERIWPPLNQEP